MESIIETFQLDLGLFIAQVINFFIVVVVLWYFALRPLNDKMNDRTKTIEKSLKEAEEISKNLQFSEEEKNQIISEARKESQQIILESKVQAEKAKNDIITKAEAESAKVAEESKKMLAGEKEKMLAEVKAEISELIVLASEKVLGKSVNKEIDSKVVAEAVNEISK